MPKLCEVRTADTECLLPAGFWSALDVWIKKPHVVNKRLCGAKEDGVREIVDSTEIEILLLSCLGGDRRDRPRLDPEQAEDVLLFLKSGEEQNFGLVEDREGHARGRWSCAVRTVIPKVNSYGSQLHKEVIVKDITQKRVTFLPFEESPDGDKVLHKSNVYQIQLKELSDDQWCVSLWALQPDCWFSDGVVYPRLTWLGSELLPRVVRWATENRLSEFKSTLSLIPIEKYGRLYQHLKDKYKEMVKVWPEVTDPEKFVYEDVAIATYLLVLWEEERIQQGTTTRQSFVDLGCGNGLLVHVLTNEGHPGKGLDVRRRKIWDMYGPQTHLEERAITPSDTCLFPNTDWLIGNHSDELTPWIPVLCARSSYSCRYFVLPCCFFDFSGKFQRRRCTVSQYREYIDFNVQVGSVCGFHVEEDCLRIPSTKRVCLIGRRRSYEPSSEAQVDAARSQYILNRPSFSTKDSIQGAGPEAAWGRGFQPRERTEVVRNCASLPRDLVDSVIQQVAFALLALTPMDSSEGAAWNQGGSLALGEVAELLDKETLRTLRKECGGLQTLLKNKHQVFRVDSGRVTLRDWRTPKPTPPETRKTQTCWFHEHHPQGCPLEAESCAFAHGTSDLQPASRPRWKHTNTQARAHTCTVR
ncbi:putative tRNA (uracil-O(2)-)-methyltransferase [Scleropages formosus]|uniref:tRNA (uracil-O(2)-)-methyltransferase n=1 Tax=Scleropages formosus TaxID=113540 RepID=A0A8C9S969_SCLFO|nr:probable tRNA (uracil-O(2)-)-methyltransferase [Scleropages formosus]